ncbi:MAG: Mor transcription activator family protein [Methylovulum sp.]|nr:Mor transcription activator family protein [Methylovulum sp.]
MTIDDGLADLLPASILLLIDLIGLTETLTLVESYGGTAIWIPKKSRQGHPVAEVVGTVAFAKLCSYAGDTYLDIPLCKRAVRTLKDQHILAESELLTDCELARKYRTTERTIRRIRARLGGVRVSDNLDLFDDFLTTP